MNFDPRAVLVHNAGREDGRVSLFDCALAFAGIARPGLNVDRYRCHGAKLCEAVRARHAVLCEGGAQNDAQTRLAALKDVIAGYEKYDGDRDSYDDLQNADIARVIDRRRGLPVALAILYIHAGRAQGWDIDALAFPGHVPCRIEAGGSRLVFDPFERGAVLDAAGLRALLKRVRGPDAELSAGYYTPLPNREILMRLQNNIKLRLVEAEDYAAALVTVEAMALLAPDDPRLLFDRGVLLSRCGRVGEAIAALTDYAERTPDARDRRDVLALIADLSHLS